MTVTVNADVTAPTVVKVEGVRSFNKVKVTFSEPVDPTTGGEVGNYTLQDTNANDITISGVSLSADGKVATLSIPTHAPGETYVLNVYSVTDRATTPNEIVTTPITFKTWVLTDGFVAFEAFLGLSVPDYQNPQPVIDAINSGVAPSFSFYTNQVYWPQSSPDMNNYGMHFHGLFRAPVTGTYKFETANDDSGNLLFSTDSTEANATLVLDFDCCTGFNAADPGYTVELTAGQSYFFDLRVVEAGGGDYAGLSVTLPSGQYLAPIPAQYLATATPPNGAIQITNQPASVAVNLLNRGTGGTLYVSEDFTADGAGFVASSSLPTDGPWTYDNASGSWKTAGQDADNGHANTALLTSPIIPVPFSGSLRLSFDHRYSFEGGEWDGGQVRYSINGSPFYTVAAAAFMSNGYSGTVLGNSASSLAGQRAFVDESAGHGANTMITSVCDLGTFNAGDTVQIQFVAASDSNSTGNQPVWEITGGRLTAGGTPFVAVFRVGTTATNLQDGANPPRFHQWYRGGVLIKDANEASYTVAPCISDNGALFSVKASVVGENTLASSAATLSVTPTSMSVSVVHLPNGDVVLTWPASFSLEETSTLINGGTVWVPSTVVSGVPFTPSSAGTFYRLASVCQ